MNLIDLYSSFTHSREEQVKQLSDEKQKMDERDDRVPLILYVLKDRLKRTNRHNHVDILLPEDAPTASQPQHPPTLFFLETKPHLRQYQFFYQVRFLEEQQRLTVRGTFIKNGLIIHLESRQQILMATRLVSNLNRDLSPLKLHVHPYTGELSLQHKAFIDSALCDLGMKRNIINLTFRFQLIIEMLMRYRFLLLYYLLRDESLITMLPSLPMLHKIPQAHGRLKKLENSIFQVSFQTYDDNHNIKYPLKREVISQHIQAFIPEVAQILKLYKSIPQISHGVEQVSNQKYNRSYIQNFISKQQERFRSRIRLKMEILKEQKWELKECGGFGVILCANVTFQVIDDDFMRMERERLDKLIFDEKLAKKVDKVKSVSKSKIESQKDILRIMNRESHPNIPTFFEDLKESQRQTSLYSLWQDNSSLKNYLSKMQHLSLYQKLVMMQQVAKGLYFLHLQQIAHLDFKPGNILVGRRLMMKLIDFGQSYCFRYHGSKSSFSYTFPYTAPEIYFKNKNDPHELEVRPAMDVYSLGVTLYQCFFGGFPWKEQIKLHKIRKTIKEILPRILPERMRDEGQSRITQMLLYVSLCCMSRAPERRPLMPWIITVLQECRLYFYELNYY